MATLGLKNTLVPQPSTIRGQTCQLSASPDGTKLVYVSGNNVIVREIEDPTKARVYAEHGKRTTIARYAPNGQWIASGDETGKIRIWWPDQEENFTFTTKYEYMMLAGEIKDIAWDGESKRIVCCGDGRQKCASAFMFDTGTSVGEFSGIAKRLNSCDIRRNRPYKAVVGGDEFSSVFYQGPPFKFVKSNLDHSQFVTCTRFSPDGSLYAACGADGDIFLYDGKEATEPVKLGSHAGGCYAVDWNSDSTQLVSASADKTIKIWDIGTKKEISSIKIGSDMGDQQLGVVWTSLGQIISVGLNGNLNYIDPSSGKVSVVITGHSRPVQALSTTESGQFLSASYDGAVASWSSNLTASKFSESHKTQIMGIHLQESGGFCSVGCDDNVRFGVTDYIQDKTCALGSQPKNSDYHNGNLVVGCMDKVVLVKNEMIKDEVSLSFEPRAVAIFGSRVIVAGEGNDNVKLFDISGGKFQENGTVKVDGGATALKFSDDGEFLAAGDVQNRAVRIFNVSKGFSLKNSIFPHNARVTALKFSPDGKYLASSDIDQSIAVWNTTAGKRKAIVKHAHRLSYVNNLVWLDDNTLVSGGQDGNIKVWDANF